MLHFFWPFFLWKTSNSRLRPSHLLKRTRNTLFGNEILYYLILLLGGPLLVPQSNIYALTLFLLDGIQMKWFRSWWRPNCLFNRGPERKKNTTYSSFFDFVFVFESSFLSSRSMTYNYYLYHVPRQNDSWLWSASLPPQSETCAHRQCFTLWRSSWCHHRFQR